MQNDPNRQLAKAMQNIQRDLQETANNTIWITMKEIESRAQQKLEDIIENNFYEFVPASKWYTRTYQLRDCAYVKATQGGGHYVLQLWLDIDALEARAPTSPKNYWSYAYSYGKDPDGEELRGREIEPEEKQVIVDYYNKKYNFLEDLQVWIEDNFPELFEKNYSTQVRKAFGYTR